ncbi:MAG: ribokinase [Bacteroidia bacterium]|nr:ribokinase [Bacteroidia bacterium]
MSSKVLVIGSSNVDLIMQIDRLPRPGETITGGVFTQVMGGKGANQAVAAVRAGASTAFISCLGNDDFGNSMEAAFKKDGLDISCISRSNSSSGTALISIDKQGENSISVAPGANFDLSPDDIDRAEELINSAELVLFQCEIHPRSLEYAIDFCYQRGKKILLNLAPAISLTEESLKKVDILILNETEAEFLSGMKVTKLQEAQESALILKKYSDTIIITLGTKGAYINGESFSGHIPAFKVTAIDTTAAGDVFCGAFAAALTSGLNLQESVQFAAAASALSVTKLGAQPSIPKKSEIDTFLSNQTI